MNRVTLMTAGLAENGKFTFRRKADAESPSCAARERSLTGAVLGPDRFAWRSSAQHTVPASSSLRVLASSYLNSVGHHFEMLSDVEAGQVADILCRLAELASGPALAEKSDAARAARCEQIKRYVDLHLSETDLTPVKVAKSLGISVRSLHLAFEPTGTSFAKHVMGRRLQECRTAIERPGTARSVTDVAFAWGFANLATFHRAFRREFGGAPGRRSRSHRPSEPTRPWIIAPRPNKQTASPSASRPRSDTFHTGGANGMQGLDDRERDPG
jgi:AraC-like DNA-binding protein